MGSRVSELISRARWMYRQKGGSAFVRGAFRHLRQQLPVELWPQLLLDPRHEADEIVPVHETESTTLEYAGRFEEALPRQLAAAEGHILGAEGVVYVFEEADLVGHRPAVRVGDRYFPPSWLGVDTAYFIHQEKYLKRNVPLAHRFGAAVSEPKPDRVVDTGFVLLGERGLEFPAWHHEVLPKLRWLEEYRESSAESPTLLLPGDVHSFQRRSLELMGYDPESWVEHGNETTRVETLLLAPHPRRARGTHLHTSVDGLDWVARRIQANVRAPDRDFSSKIYISRADANKRQVHNEGEVTEMLREEGFECYEPGRLGYEEEVHLFANAEVIVGTHGKGLASMFHAEDATLVELFPRNGATEHYFLTAAECEFDYEFLACQPVYDDRNVRPRDRDLVVDVEALRDLITRL